jgi:hypothetical protein
MMAITAGQVDDFQDLTVMDWGEGAPSPNPPTNISDGGPAGAGDAFLQDESSGGFGAGSKLVMKNSVQWAGDYNVTATLSLTAAMANFGNSTLHMRVAIRGGPGGTTYGSTLAIDLPADGLWHPFQFDLTSSSMTNISGADGLTAVLGSVTELRILSAAAGPSFSGDAVIATLGVDNITAIIDPAAPSLRVTDMALVSHVPRVSFTTVNGRSYRVERKTVLTDTTWTVVTNAANVSGTGGVVQVDDPDPGAGNLPSRFYVHS